MFSLKAGRRGEVDGWGGGVLQVAVTVTTDSSSVVTWHHKSVCVWWGLFSIQVAWEALLWKCAS